MFSTYDCNVLHTIRLDFDLPNLFFVIDSSLATAIQTTKMTIKQKNKQFKVIYFAPFIDQILYASATI